LNIRIIVALSVLIAIIVAAAVYFTYSLSKQNVQYAALIGGGATFPQPVWYSWISEFEKKYNISVSYQAVGSGAGISNFLQGVYHFAGSDPPLPQNIWSEHRGKVLQFPIVLGAVVIIYNIPELRDVNLNLSGEVLALIYLGNITHWDDPRIKELNPAVADKLPHKEIIAIHRSDSSGTTKIFTTFLYKASNGIWPQNLVGLSIDWPVDKTGRGIGAPGNPGVANAVLNTPYSIGYVEWNYAITLNISIARIKDREGIFILPSDEAIKAAAANALQLVGGKSPEDDWNDVYDAVVYAPGGDSYPIASFSHMIVWKKYSDPAVCNSIKKLIEFIATEGDRHVPLGYVPVPQSVKEVMLKAADMISC